MTAGAVSTDPTTRSDTAVVEAHEVSRVFGSGATAVVAVDRCDCVIARGEQIVLTGSSGSGKTTLLHLLAGLDTPTSGTIDWPAIGGRQDLRPGPVAVVFQAPSLLPALDVAENVALPLLLAGAAPDDARAGAADALAHLGLDDLSAKLPEELSGGQAQRVAVARALAGKPVLILADEPTGQLDHDNGVMIVDALIAAATAIDASLVVNTHDESVTERLSTRWTMDDGHLRVSAPGSTVGDRSAATNGAAPDVATAQEVVR